jgi:hypothetical protein
MRRMVLVLTCFAVGLGPAARLARAEGAAVDQATATQKRAAQERFDEAMTAFRAKRLGEALAGFRASYEIVASPNARLMVVNVLQDLGQVVAAYREAQATREAAEAAAAHDEGYAAAAQGARQVLAQLRARVALVTVKVVRAAGDRDPGRSQGDERLTLTVAGEQIDRTDWGKPVAVEPGQCEVVLTADTGTTARKEIAVSAGGAIEITIGPPGARPSPDDEPDRAKPGDSSTAPDAGASDDGTKLLVSGCVIGALGVGGAVLFAVFGSLAKSNYDDLVEQCPGDRCPAGLESKADTIRTQQLVANMGLAVGAVGLATGVSLLVASVVVGGSSAKPQPTAGVSFGPGSVIVSGSF